MVMHLPLLINLRISRITAIKWKKNLGVEKFILIFFSAQAGEK